MARAERIREEAIGLWIEVFGEAPSDELDGSQLLTLLFNQTAPPDYARLNAALRSRNLTWPRGR